VRATRDFFAEKQKEWQQDSTTSRYVDTVTKWLEDEEERCREFCPYGTTIEEVITAIETVLIAEMAENLVTDKGSGVQVMFKEFKK
jgi:hypothetical protein